MNTAVSIIAFICIAAVLGGIWLLVTRLLLRGFRREWQRLKAQRIRDCMATVQWTGPSGGAAYDRLQDRLAYSLLPEYRAWAIAFWDTARQQHADGFRGSDTRETFESILDSHDEDIRDALAEIRRLREGAAN